MKQLTREQTLSAIQQLTHRQMKVYFCIVTYYSDKYGYSNPTAETIAKDTCTPINKVYGAIRELKTLGFIRTEKYNKNNIYYILDNTSVQNDTDVTVDDTPDVYCNPKTYLQYPTPESITCLSDGELKQLWTKLRDEKRFYNVSGVEAMRYDRLMNFIRDIADEMWNFCKGSAYYGRK